MLMVATERVQKSTETLCLAMQTKTIIQSVWEELPTSCRKTMSPSTLQTTTDLDGSYQTGKINHQALIQISMQSERRVKREKPSITYKNKESVVQTWVGRTKQLGTQYSDAVIATRRDATIWTICSNTKA